MLIWQLGDMQWETPVSCLFFKPTCQKQKHSKIHGNNACQFQSLDVCARQFLWLSAGEKIGILPSRRLQSVTSSWVWFEWTTYRFSAGLTHTRATHFPHRACVLIPEWMRLRAWKRASRHMRWMTLSLGGFFQRVFSSGEIFHLAHWTWLHVFEFELDPGSDCLLQHGRISPVASETENDTRI